MANGTLQLIYICYVVYIVSAFAKIVVVIIRCISIYVYRRLLSCLSRTSLTWRRSGLGDSMRGTTEV